MKKLVSIAIALVMSLSICSFAFAGENTAGDTQKKAAVPQEIKDKKVQLKALFDKAKATRSELEATKGQVKARLDGIKAEFKDMTAEEKAAAKTELLALKEKIKANRTGIEALRAELKIKTEAMTTNRTQLKASVKAADYAAASSALDNMLQIKAEKNADLEKILDLRIKTLNEIK